LVTKSNSKPAKPQNSKETTIRTAVAELVRAQRQAHEPPLSQEELAYRAKISFEHLNHIENSKATPSLEVLDRIAKALGYQRLSELLILDAREVL
jgi:ribosome-binding protein aMBF1 (putative translation factor)